MWFPFTKIIPVVERVFDYTFVVALECLVCYTVPIRSSFSEIIRRVYMCNILAPITDKQIDGERLFFSEERGESSPNFIYELVRIHIRQILTVTERPTQKELDR